MTTDEQKKALAAILDALEEGVRAAGTHGAPAGVMYAALLDKVTLAQFQMLMAALIRMGRITQRGDLYFAR